MSGGNMAWLIVYAALIGGVAWLVFRYRAFYREAWQELRDKVTWPGWKEVRGTTLVVLLVVLAFAVFLGACDYIFAPTINWVIEQFR